jgi:hypothetical protein
MQTSLAEPVSATVPFIVANLNGDSVAGYGWPNNLSVTLTIDDPSTAVEVDYTANAITTTFAFTPIGPNTQAIFSLTNVFDVKPGLIVTITDGAVSKESTTANLSIISIDTKTRAIAGTATPGAVVTTGCGKGCYAEQEIATADSEGNWVMPIPYDIVRPLQFNGYIREDDADGDWTLVNVSVTIPPSILYLPVILQ